MHTCDTYKKFIRAKSYDDYEKSITNLDFIAYLDTKKWLEAMDDLLFFCQRRIKDSDFYTGE
ncbi:hypothetical protein ACP0SG_01905 [Campylobacter lari]|uniref:hypothetical protein n=1 Tax=Campylobacter TaxID=194 RepID=UPI000B11C27A|nr:MULTISPECIES: hypothetical protein [Campylobacter]EGK8089015.1 hypothetical protein [Campylobacter lari]MBF7047920.1 hypothetical protein [Campylobacter volucris]MCV3498099.1 hypothetical protein [Campylobacter lari]MCV3522801.1 hypothetical protein [Campylobacter lari]MCV3528340.1 hypothetical protein [Campylobacter lari]